MRFKKICSGENWDATLRSPLAGPGVEVKLGDYLLAVNGKSWRAPPIYRPTLQAQGSRLSSVD